MKNNKKIISFNKPGSVWVWAVILVSITILTVAFAWNFFNQSISNDSNMEIPISDNSGSPDTQGNLSYFSSVIDNDSTDFNGVHEFWLNGDIMYITSVKDHGIEIMDVSNPANPVRLGSFVDNEDTLMKKPHTIVFKDNYGFVSSMEDSAIQVLDLSDPANPIPVASIKDNAQMGLKGVHGISIKGNYIYASGTAENALTIIDISDPKNPKHTRTIFDDDILSLSKPHQTAFDGSYAYIVSGDEGLEVMDISDPAFPKHAATCNKNGHGHGVVGGHDVEIRGKYAYIASYVDGFSILSIEDPLNPTYVSEIHPTEENGLMSAADLDISYDGKYAFVVSEVGHALVMIDISNPQNPEIVDTIKDDGSGSMFLWNGHFVRVIGNYVYVAGLQEGFGIVKFSSK